MKMTKKLLSILLIILMLAVTVTGCLYVTVDEPNSTPSSKPSSSEEDKSASDTLTQGDLKIHFIDVGQADCIYIELPNDKSVLIDAGNRDDKDVIKSYLNGLKVDKIDYMILTHPHEDHIGSAPDVLNSFKVGAVYLPDYTVTTKIFENTISAIKNNSVKAIKAVAGDYIIDEDNLKLQILSPGSSKYDDTNDYSIVTKLTYKNNSFMLTGDAGQIPEAEMIKNGYDLKSDLLKVGHHGSRTSTSEEFLKAVSPKYAVIQCGKGNDYGHPHKETMDRLNSANVEIYRNDLSGTIVVTSDGNNIVFDKSVESNNNTSSSDVNKEVTYIGNKNSKVYHTESCKSLPKPENQVKFSSKAEAEQNGYKPCSSCNP